MTNHPEIKNDKKLNRHLSNLIVVLCFMLLYELLEYLVSGSFNITTLQQFFKKFTVLFVAITIIDFIRNRIKSRKTNDPEKTE